ncbi:MAG: glycosyltransferase family 39 protein [Bacteroidota bacterium]|nr:glycosyltransferase family 39 protein [Bacteroidota bacterium]
MNNPLKPTLFATPILDYDYRNWTGNYIWLHKQPLFLWQIALSLKFFGINELSVRIPSIILHALATIMIYRIGKISINSTIGFYGALFFTVAYYPLELIAGKYATDHNDVAFLFYVVASFWSWFEFQQSQKRYWIILIGIFSGCAVLVKWLFGLLIYFVWIISIGATDRRNWIKLKSYFPVLSALAISVFVFIPWQLYILNKFPSEARYEYELNSAHLFRAVEGHAGNIWFHFDAVKKLYGSGDAIPFLLLFGFFLLLKNTRQIFRIAILSMIIFTFGFYSFAATKMTSFTIVVFPFAFLGLATLTDSAINLIRKRIPYNLFENIFRPIALTTICLLLINLSRIKNYHTEWKPEDNCNRTADIEQMAFIKKISDTLHDSKYVVFNADVRVNGHIPVMFYTDFIAYDFVPGRSQIEKAKSQSYKIAILDTKDLPDYIRNDNEIVKIK